jgi:plastocyanin
MTGTRESKPGTNYRWMQKSAASHNSVGEKDGTKAGQTFVYSGVDITPELKRLTSAFTKVFLFV